MRKIFFILIAVSLSIAHEFTSEEDVLISEETDQNVIYLEKHYDVISEMLDDQSIIDVLGNLTDVDLGTISADQDSTLKLIDILHSKTPGFPDALEKINNFQKKFDTLWHIQHILRKFEKLDDDKKKWLLEGLHPGPARAFFEKLMKIKNPKKSLEVFLKIDEKFKGSEVYEGLRELLSLWTNLDTEMKETLGRIWRIRNRSECVDAVKYFGNNQLLGSVLDILKSKVKLGVSCLDSTNIDLHFDPDIKKLVELWENHPGLKDGSLVNVLIHHEKINSNVTSITKNLVWSFKNHGIGTDEVTKFLNILDKSIQKNFQYYNFLNSSWNLKYFDFNSISSTVKKFNELDRWSKYKFIEEKVKPTGSQKLYEFFVNLSALRRYEYFFEQVQNELIPEINKLSQDDIEFSVAFLKYWEELGSYAVIVAILLFGVISTQDLIATNYPIIDRLIISPSFDFTDESFTTLDLPPSTAIPETSDPDIKIVLEKIQTFSEKLVDGSIMNFTIYVDDADIKYWYPWIFEPLDHFKNAASTRFLDFLNELPVDFVVALRSIERLEKNPQLFWNLRDAVYLFEKLNSTQKGKLANSGENSTRNFVKELMKLKNPKQSLDVLYSLYFSLEGLKHIKELKRALEIWKSFDREMMSSFRQVIHANYHDKCIKELRKNGNFEAMKEATLILDKLGYQESCIARFNVTFDFDPNITELVEYWQDNLILRDGSFIDVLEFFEYDDTDLNPIVRKVYGACAELNNTDSFNTANLGSIFEILNGVTDSLPKIQWLLDTSKKFKGFNTDYVFSITEKFTELDFMERGAFIFNTLRNVKSRALVDFFERLNVLKTSYMKKYLREWLHGLDELSEQAIERFLNMYKIWENMDYKAKYYALKMLRERGIEKKECLEIWETRNEQIEMFQFVKLVDQYLLNETCFKKFGLEY